jgi:hypothetical protein
MISWQRAGVLLFCVVAAAAATPKFVAAGVARGTMPARMVVPNTFLTIYGSNLGPLPGRCAEVITASTRPVEICGTQVFIDDMPAELLYVAESQINFKVPRDSPQGGTVDIRVVYNGQSSLPVSMKAGFEQVTVSVDGPAYTDMPIWLKIELPYEFGRLSFSSILGPAGFGCNEIEVRRNGRVLPVLFGADWTRYGIVFSGNICGGAQVDRLPLHLLYRIDLPGVYEVRYTLLSAPVGFAPPQSAFRVRSQWTPIEVLAAKPGQRSEWLRSLRDQAPSDALGLLTDFLPSILGVPDDASFDILAGYLYHPNSSVQRYVLNGLSYWPEEYTLHQVQTLLQTRGASDAVTRYMERERAIAAKRQ